MLGKKPVLPAVNGGKGKAIPKIAKTPAQSRANFQIPARQGLRGPKTAGWAKKRQHEDGYGSRLGSLLGEGAEALAKHVFGFGDYGTPIKKNSLVKKIDFGGMGPPVIRNSNSDHVVVSHREYIGDLYTGPLVEGGDVTVFDIKSFDINVGNPLLFPWMANMAHNFQEWDARGIIVEAKTLASEYASNVSLGATFMAVDYNSLDDPPLNKKELENMDWAMSAKPSSSIMMPVECKRSDSVTNNFFVSIDGDYQGGDRRLFNLGTLFIGTSGVSAAETPVAEIWITYEVALLKPKIHSELQSTYVEWNFLPGNSALFNSPEVISDAREIVQDFTSSAFTLTEAAYGRTFIATVSASCASEVMSATGVSFWFDEANSVGVEFMEVFPNGGNQQGAAVSALNMDLDSHAVALYTLDTVAMFRVEAQPEQTPKLVIVGGRYPGKLGETPTSGTLVMCQCSKPASALNTRSELLRQMSGLLPPKPSKEVVESRRIGRSPPALKNVSPASDPTVRKTVKTTRDKKDSPETKDDDCLSPTRKFALPMACPDKYLCRMATDARIKVVGDCLLEVSEDDPEKFDEIMFLYTRFGFSVRKPGNSKTYSLGDL